MHSVDFLKERINEILNFENKKQNKENNINEQNPAHIKQTLLFQIQSSDDEEYSVNLGIMFCSDGSIKPIDEIENISNKIWFTEDTFYNIYEMKYSVM